LAAVRSEMESALEIWRFVSPLATKSTTSR
jgi:hypothetical protein